MISTVEELERVVGERPRTAMLKSIPVLDDDHVRLNDTPGMVARLARKAISPTVMDKGLAHDYEHDLH